MARRGKYPPLRLLPPSPRAEPAPYVDPNSAPIGTATGQAYGVYSAVLNGGRTIRVWSVDSQGRIVAERFVGLADDALAECVELLDEAEPSGAPRRQHIRLVQ